VNQEDVERHRADRRNGAVVTAAAPAGRAEHPLHVDAFRLGATGGALRCGHG